MGSGPVIWLSLIQSDEGGDETLELVQDRLESFTFIDRDRGKDVCELRFRDRDMALLDNPAFRKGQKLAVTWGWPDNIATPRRMIVKRTKEVNLVKLLDESVLLDRSRKSRVWHDVYDSDVVYQIAEENGYEGILADVLQTFVIRHAITQEGTDAALLNQLARRNGFVWYIDAAGLHFHPRRWGVEPTHFFTYVNAPGLGDVLSPPVIQGNVQDVSKIRVVARDPITKETVEAEVGATTDDETLGDYLEHYYSLGDDEEIGDPDNPDGRRQARASSKETINIGLATQEEVSNEAAARYFETAQGRYKMEVTLRGNPQVGAKQLHYFKLPSEAFTGLYYCTEARTEITPGSYKIMGKYRKDALGKLAAKKVLSVGRKKNKKPADVPLDENGQPADTSSLEKMLTWGEENGQPVPKWQYKDKSGTSVGSSTAVTAAEWSALPANQRDDLISKSAGGLVLPGE